MSGSFLAIQWTDSNGNDQEIDIDCSVSERHTSAGEVTEHAVEEGAAISDHLRPKPRSYEFECILSNTPIESPSFGMDGASGSVQGLTVTVGGQQFTANTWQFDQPFDRVATAYNTILDLIDNATVVTIQTGKIPDITPCVITEFEWNRSAENGNDLACTLSVTRVRIASSQRVSVTAPRQRRGQQQTNRGNQPAVQDDRSFAARLLDQVSPQISALAGGG